MSPQRPRSLEEVVREVRLAARDTGALEEIPSRPGPADADGTPLRPGIQRVTLLFAFIDEPSMPVLLPRLHAVAPHIKAVVDHERTSGLVVGYRYDLVDRAYEAHHGFHLHGHGGPSTPHRQGCHLVPSPQPAPELGFDDAVYQLIEECWAHRVGRG